MPFDTADTVLMSSGGLKEQAGPRRRPAYRLALGLILIASFLWRVRSLDRAPISGDEGVAAINALSVLEHGVPSNLYLGQPIFDNNFIRPWNGNPEYEFKDVGYGPAGLKFYHNWLPIYSFAGALRIFGIRPGDAAATRPIYTPAERRRMTFAVRLVALLFGMLSIVGLWLAGSALDSAETGIVAALFGAFFPLYVSLSGEAHYYSAALALSAICVWSIARMLRRSRISDFACGGVLFSILFHCSMLSAIILCGVWAASLILMRRKTGSWPIVGIVVFGAIMAVLCLPWMIVTGLIAQNGGIPKAIALLKLPRDFVSKLEFYPFYALAGLAFALWLSTRVPASWPPVVRWREEVRQGTVSYYLLYAWFAMVLLAFLMLVPAAGFGLTRVALALLVPAVLLASQLLVAAARAISPLRARTLAFAATVLLLLAANRLQPGTPENEARSKTRDIDAVVDYLAASSFPPGTKLYADPNEHLILTFYTGLPIQNIGAVRKGFLDTYPAPIVYLEKEELSATDPIQPVNLKAAAAAHSSSISSEEAAALSCQLASLRYRTGLISRVALVRPPLEPVSPVFVEAARLHEIADQKRQARLSADAHRKSLLFREEDPVKTNFDWWNGYFFAFVDAPGRKAHPNFEDRLRNAAATVLACSNWTAFYSAASAR